MYASVCGFGLEVRHSTWPGSLSYHNPMVKNPPGNTYELHCDDAYFVLVAEAVKLHSLRTRRIQTLRKLIEFSLHDEFWRSVPFEADDILSLLRTVGVGPVTFYVKLPAREVELLRLAKSEMQIRTGRNLSTLDMFAVLLRLSLDVGGGEWAAAL